MAKILLVEDDKLISRMICRRLNHYGHQMKAAFNGQEGIEKALADNFDLILMDMNMPIMDGREAVQVLRSKAYSGTIVAITATVLNKETDRVMASGCNAVITKPVGVDFEQQVQHILNMATDDIAPNAATPHDELKELQKDYMAELPKQLNAIKKCWNKLSNQEWNQANLKQLHQLVHRLAGSGDSFGFPDISKTACKIERLLTPLIEKKQPPTQPQQKRIHTLLLDFQEIDEPVNNATEACITPTESSAEPRLIYMLDSDQRLAEKVAQQLSRFGFSVQLFCTARELEQAINKQRPAALIADINLAEGELAGAQAAQRIQAHCAKDLPVIFHTSCNDFPARLAAARAGASSYIIKPADIDSLVAQLESLTRNKKTDPYSILLVDDDKQLAAHYAAILKGAGMQVTVINQAADTLNVLVDQHPELILMDLYMSGCSGLELAAIIRQHSEFINIPIVYLSTEASIDRQLNAMRTGGDDFLTKPIQDNHLIANIATRVERARVLNKLMVLDSLTGLLNHTRLKEQLAAELTRCSRSKGSVTFVMIDIDHFKRVNDTFGHLTGDRILKSLSNLLRMRVRKSDTVGRYGGEEFAIILPDCSTREACRVIDEIRENFSQISYTHEGRTFNVTFSAGIAPYHAGMNAEQLTQAADNALYQAKDAGRNRIIINNGRLI